MGGFLRDNDILDQVIIPMHDWHSKHTGLISRLNAFQLEASRLPQYALLIISGASYHEVQGHLAHDLLNANPELMMDQYNFQRIVHECIDAVVDAARDLSIRLLNLFNNEDITTVRFERWLGHGLVITRPRTFHDNTLSDIATAA